MCSPTQETVCAPLAERAIATNTQVAHHEAQKPCIVQDIGEVRGMHYQTAQSRRPGTAMATAKGRSGERKHDET